MHTTQPSYWKSPEEIALLLTLKPARKPEGKRVQAAVLARVEISLAIMAAMNDNSKE